VLLQQANATVTQCHSRTRDLREHCRAPTCWSPRSAVPKLVQRDWVKPGAAVIDVGVSDVDGGAHGRRRHGRRVRDRAARDAAPARRRPDDDHDALRNTLLAYEQRTGA
jgi:methylenetetrahydrofolate dehydrogenase (NADP+)/methenyltetrahydrofolate cyclohydrolase